MAASPGPDALHSIGDMYPAPSPASCPSLPPAQDNSSLTTAVPPETTQLDHATPTPPPPPEQETAEHSDLGESPPPKDCGDLGLSLPPPEAAPPAPPALEAASRENPTFSPPPCALGASVAPSCPPGSPAEEFPDVSASAASPPPPPQIGEAPPGGAPQPMLSPPTPLVTTSPDAVLDSSTTDLVAMASREAASPTAASELDSHSAPAPLTPPLESGLEGLPLQKHLRPATPSMTPQVCENPEPTQPPPESTYILSDAAVDEVAAGASTEAARSIPALDAEKDTAPLIPAALESGAVGELSPQQPRSPHLEIVAPLCQNSEPAELSQQLPPSAESTYCSLEAAVNEVAAVSLEESARSPPAPYATGGEAALESQSEGPLQEPMQRSSCPKMEAEACSPDMAPPGFENFKSKWLPQPAHTLPVQSTHYLVEAPVTDNAGTMLEAAAGSLPRLETMDMEMDIPAGQLPSSKNAENIPLMLPSSLAIEAAPCSPDTPPPGFENFKTSWLPQPTIPPSAETTYLPDVATTKEELAEKSCSVLALDTTDMEIDMAQNLLPTLESGAGDLLEVPQPSSPPHEMQPASCLPHITPPEFESSTLPQLQLPSPLSQLSHIVQDSAATGDVCLTSEDAPQPSPVLKAMDVVPALPLSSESGAQESMQQEQLQLPSSNGQCITCSLEIVSSRSENLETLEDAVNTVEAVSHPLSVPEAMEEAKGHILSPQLEGGCDGPLPCLEPKASSPTAQAVTSSRQITTTGFENLESSQQTSPCRAERIDPASNLPFKNYVTSKSEKTTHPSPLQTADKDMESAQVLQSPLKSEQSSLPHPQHQPSSPSGKDAPCSPGIAPPRCENLDSSEELPPPPSLCTNFDTEMECAQVLQSLLKSEQRSLPHPQHQPSSPSGKDAPCSPEIAPPGYENLDSSEELPPPPSLCTNFDTDMEGAQVLQSPLKSEQRSLPHQQHQPSSPSGKDAPCSPDIAPPGYENLDSEELPPPPPLCTNFELGQMVCGCCRELIAYPMGATHVQCFGCWTINLVLEAHQVGKVCCGQCGTLLMYPFGAPAVRCSNCLFVTEIGERNVRQRMSAEQGTPPHPQEVVQA